MRKKKQEAEPPDLRPQAVPGDEKGEENIGKSENEKVEIILPFSFFLPAREAEEPSSFFLYLLLHETSEIEPSQISCISNNQENSQTQQQYQTSLHHIFLNFVRQRFTPQSFY